MKETEGDAKSAPKKTVKAKSGIGGGGIVEVWTDDTGKGRIRSIDGGVEDNIDNIRGAGSSETRP